MLEDIKKGLMAGFGTIFLTKDKIEEATKNARDVAIKFAEDSQSRVGKIKVARQGLFTISDRDQNTPEIKIVRVVSTLDFHLQD